MKTKILISTLLIALSFISCRAIREAKDSKAVGRVLSNPSLTDQVYKVAIGLHPVSPEIIYVRGKDTTYIDSIPYPIDVIHEIEKKCPTLNIDSLRRLLQKTVYKERVDTFYKDNPNILRLINIANENNSFLRGQITEKDRQFSEAKSAKNKLMWVFIASCVIIVGLVYLLFKRK